MDGGSIVEQGLPAEMIAHPCEERTQRFLSKVL
jgi:ABC-type polar amino acid transport system ATPase subunit